MFRLTKILAVIFACLSSFLAHSQSSVVELEYFFDDDPGYDDPGATNIVSFTPGTTVSINELIPTSGLSIGFHTLYMRVKVDNYLRVDSLKGGTGADSSDLVTTVVSSVWGLPESRLIYVDASGADAVVVDRVEAFFDHDPGYGNGADVGTFVSANNINFTDLIPTDTLDVGFHTLYLRAQGAGGSWGIPEPRLVFVDLSGTVALVDTIEYFIDHDPGYGQGTVLADPITPANSVNIVDAIFTDTLAIGFHTLYIRPKLQGGSWGIPEQRLIYVDLSGTTIVNIDRLKYFIDADPGYGAGTTVPISTPAPEIHRQVAMAASALSPGSHFAGIRARDENGRWGIPEIVNFYSYSPGRELDSASLVVLFDKTGGAGGGWTNDNNWQSTNIDNWYGVTVTNGRVDSLDLSNNGLIGEIPKELGYVLNMTSLDLSGNNLLDTIPSSLTDLSLLTGLGLHDNQLHQLPDLSVITGLTTVSLDSNLFDFGDLEPLAGIQNLTYSNQKVYNDFASDTIAKIGVGFTINKTVEGNNNLFQWFLNGDSIFLADLEDYTQPSFQATDTGVYVLKVRNDILTDLELTTTDFHIGISDFEEDSLALVSLYNSTQGAGWTSGTNWLAGNLVSWQGVTLGNNRVTGLSLPGNNLNGNVLWDFGYADSLVNIDLSDNQIADTIPESWEGFKALVAADLSNNDLGKIPNFNPLTVSGSLTTMDISGNRIQFGDIEQNLSISSFTYVPQDTLFDARDTLFDANTNPVIAMSLSGANNTYQWLKNGVPVGTGFSGGTTSALTISNAQFEDEGEYVLRVRNNIVTDLTLLSGAVNVGITSLLRDSAALAALYQATGGATWTSANNWTTGAIDTWEGVTLNTAQDRVVGLSLPGNNLQNTLPARIRDITSMETVDLSDNELTSLPNLTTMPNITSLDIRENRIGMAELEVNQTVPGIEFDPQKEIGTASTEKVDFGSDVMLTTQITGNSNQYQWYRNGTMVEGATASSYTISAIDFSKMGDYHSVVTSPNIPDFSITRSIATVLATTSLSGVVTDPDETPLADGDAILYGVVQAGPYDSLSLDELGANGSYSFDQIVLGNYLVLTRPDRTQNPDYIQTYYGNTLFWENADTIELRQPGQSFDIQMTGPPSPSTGTNEVLGTIELEFLEAETGRTLARRKVQRAGCSMRRLRSAGRTVADDDYELIAYVESNDEGAFDFGSIPAGQYRFNIQYPGIPMDEDSYVEFVLAEEETLILSALITEFGISVTRIPLGIRPSISDFKLYPNPVSEKASIEYRIRKKVGKATLKIWSTSGQLVREVQAPATRGSHSVTLDVSEWDHGVYFLMLQTDLHDVVIRSKIIVERK